LTSDRLSLRALNRATLKRQLLLRRASLPARQAVGQLAGLQAQAPLAPYVGLWTRLAGFRPQHLKDLLTERALVRAHLMRNTVHLVTAEDFVSFRPLFQPKIDRDLAGNFGRNLTGVDLAEVRRAARALLAERPLTRGQLAAELAPGWPDHDPASLAYAATHLLPLVQVPPRGLWGENGQATFFLADVWLADVWLDGLEDAGSGSPPDPARQENAREPAGAAVPGRLRAGQRARHPGLVRAVEAARGDRAPRCRSTRGPAAQVHRSRRRPAPRPAGRARAGTRSPGAPPVPARI
jgi:hypothetical protein